MKFAKWPLVFSAARSLPVVPNPLSSACSRLPTALDPLLPGRLELLLISLIDRTSVRFESSIEVMLVSDLMERLSDSV